MPPYASRQACRGIASTARAFTGRAVSASRRLVRTVSGRVAAGFDWLVKPRSIGEDDARREYILNVILVLSLGLFMVLEVIILYNRYVVFGTAYAGIGPGAFATIIAAYAALFTLSRKGRATSASYILIAFYVAGAAYSGWTWGVTLPATMLISAMVVVISGILIGSGFGFAMTIAMIVLLTILGVHEAVVLVIPDWRQQVVSTTDILASGGVLFFMGFVSWLSNREIKRSLARAKKSEKLLAEERDSLERRVAERTSELVDSERARTGELERVARFGELSRGLFHDLMDPIQSISLSIEQLEKAGVSPAEARNIMDMAVKASRRMRSFMDSVKRSLEGSGTMEQAFRCDCPGDRADIAKELAIVRDILAYKARMAGVDIQIERVDGVMVPAHPVRVYQLMLNLISNAIEAYPDDSDEPTREEKTVCVSLMKRGVHAVISVSDNGRGMNKERLEELRSHPSSDKRNGIGIGLTTVRTIVEKELGGAMDIKSEQGRGTTFTITIPLHEHGNEDSRGDRTSCEARTG